MDLPALNLNRQMYKVSPLAVENPVYMSADINSQREARSKNSNEKDKKDAREVITGTVITACLIKSSDQDDRIEIGQNLDSLLTSNFIGSLDFSQARGLDYLAAFRPGSRIGFILTGIGAVYIGYGMPAMKTISLIEGQTLVLQTTSEVLWSMTQLSPGVYQITHNLNSRNYSISAIATDAGSPNTNMVYVGDKGLNSFTINVYNVPTASFVDSDFDCTVAVFK